VIAEITFFRHMVYGVEKPHSVRAGHDAIAAPDAPLLVHQDYSLRGSIGGAYRTYLDTGRFFTLVAELGHKKGFLNFFPGDFFIPSLPEIDSAGGETIPRLLGGVCEYPFFFGNDVTLNPGAGDIGLKGDFILELTGFDTEAAPNALIGVHQKYPADGPRRSMQGNGPEDFIQPPG
jgi:hypothetical protein